MPNSKKRTVNRKKEFEIEKRKRELDAEREKNRQRKLNAVSNREWDSSKNEEDYNPSNYTNRSRRGAHGTITGTISSPSGDYHRHNEAEDGEQEDGYADSPRGQGRGRGGRRGEGRGRGGRGGGGYRQNDGGPIDAKFPQSTPANIQSEADFPALPGSKALVVLSPIEPGGSWAEQAQDAAEKADVN